MDSAFYTKNPWKKNSLKRWKFPFHQFMSDKIFDLEHFLPPPSPTKAIKQVSFNQWRRRMAELREGFLNSHDAHIICIKHTHTTQKSNSMGYHSPWTDHKKICSQWASLRCYSCLSLPNQGLLKMRREKLFFLFSLLWITHSVIFFGWLFWLLCSVMPWLYHLYDLVRWRWESVS